MKNKIGEIITVAQDLGIKIMDGKQVRVKKGDKAFVDSRKRVHYITGDARGMIQATNNIEIEGYAHSNIAKLIFEELDLKYDLREVLVSDYEISEEEFISDIEDVITNIF